MWIGDQRFNQFTMSDFELLTSESRNNETFCHMDILKYKKLTYSRWIFMHFKCSDFHFCLRDGKVKEET